MAGKAWPRPKKRPYNGITGYNWTVLEHVYANISRLSPPDAVPVETTTSTALPLPNRSIQSPKGNATITVNYIPRTKTHAIVSRPRVKASLIRCKNPTLYQAVTRSELSLLYASFMETLNSATFFSSESHQQST